MKQELIGQVFVDSGQLIVTDPCYIDSQWEKKEYENFRAHKDKKTKKIYMLGLFHSAEKLDELDKKFKGNIVYFANYEIVLSTGKTPNQHIKDGEWEDFDFNKKDDSFSYNGVCQREDDHKQIGKGTALVFSTGFGDGCYPVFAKRSNGRIKEITIKFF